MKFIEHTIAALSYILREAQLEHQFMADFCIALDAVSACVVPGSCSSHLKVEARLSYNGGEPKIR